MARPMWRTTAALKQDRRSGQGGSGFRLASGFAALSRFGVGRFVDLRLFRIVVLNAFGNKHDVTDVVEAVPGVQGDSFLQGHHALQFGVEIAGFEVFIGEHDGKTRAEARLHTEKPTGHIGIGTARLNPTDTDVPAIGDELAVARALSELAHQLLHAAAEDIGRSTHERVSLSR